MVAVVSGNSLGISLSSLAVLGQRGLPGSAGQGRSGELAYVNVATGNLVLQNRDEFIQGRGLDLLSLRTYNSQGALDEDGAIGWNVGAFGQSVLLKGSVSSIGSTLVRTDRDGAKPSTVGMRPAAGMSAPLVRVLSTLSLMTPKPRNSFGLMVIAASSSAINPPDRDASSAPPMPTGTLSPTPTTSMAPFDR